MACKEDQETVIWCEFLKHPIEGLKNLASSRIFQERSVLNRKRVFISAMDEYNPVSIAEDREYMGVILQDDGHYFYTVTRGQRRSDNISIRIQRSMLPCVTALWHTHGSPARERQYFSDVDTRSANSHGRCSYLGDYTGNFRVFEPGDKVYSVYQATGKGLPGMHGFGAGKLMQDENGQIIEIAS